MRDRDRQLAKPFEVIDFLLDGLAVGLGQYFRCSFFLIPLLRHSVECFKVFFQRRFQWVRPVSLSKAFAESLAH